MSEVELLDAGSPWWSPFAGVLLIALFLLGCWVIVHPRLTWAYLSLVWRRGRDYRRQLRRARHRQRRDSLHHYSFRKAVR